jgi:hypothetical protein
MFSPRIHRAAIAFTLICALAGPAATAQANRDRATAAAVAQERYYSSYGEPAPLMLPQSAAPPDDSPWAPVAVPIVAAAAALMLAYAAAARRRRIGVTHTT